MSEIWKPQSEEIYKHWISTIENEASDKLSEWEMDFLESISKYLDKKGTLTEKQAKILERIYAEKTS